MRRTTPLRTIIVNTRQVRIDALMCREVQKGLSWKSSREEHVRVRVEIVLEQLGGISCPDMF